MPMDRLTTSCDVLSPQRDQVCHAHDRVDLKEEIQAHDAALRKRRVTHRSIMSLFGLDQEEG